MTRLLHDRLDWAIDSGSGQCLSPGLNKVDVRLGALNTFSLLVDPFNLTVQVRDLQR